MLSSIDKIRRLEKLFALNNTPDNIIVLTIDKIFKRESSILKNKIQVLKNQIKAYEKKYKLDSGQLKTKYDNGLLGDNVDFVEWSSSLDMIKNAEKQLSIILGT